MTVLAAFLLVSFVGISSAYDVGKIHKYSYETTVVINEQCGQEGSPQTIGHKVKAAVQLTAIWVNPQNTKQKLIKIQILNPKLLLPKQSSFQERSSGLDSGADLPSYLVWEDGSPVKIWEDPKEAESIRNLKRGISSLLRIKQKDEEGKEEDVSGTCDVQYLVRGKLMRKRKGNCVHSKFDKSLSQPYSVRSSTVQHHSTTDCELQDEAKPILSKCSVSEFVKMFSNTWHRPSLCTNSITELYLEKIEGGGEKHTDDNIENVLEKLKKNHEGLESSSLESILLKSEELHKTLKSYLTSLASYLKTKHLAEFKSASAFYRLLPVIRESAKEDVTGTLKDSKFKEIKPQLLDLVAACGTEECLSAALEHFSGEKEYNEELERFLVSLSLLPRPGEFVLNQLMSFQRKNKLEERIQASVLTTLGTLLKTYSENYEVAKKEVVEKVRKDLEDRLRGCGDPECSLNYLRALKNAAHPTTVPLFLEYATKGGRGALEALLALKKIPERFITPQNQKILLDVFNQAGANQDRSTRSTAFELILRQHPKPEILKKLLKRLSDKEDPEFTTYLHSKLNHMMSTDKLLKKSVAKVLPEVLDYDFGSQKGQSSVFTRPLLSVQGTNVTYGMEAEMLVGGLMKRCLFDVSFENTAGGSNLLNVGIFAEGLGGFAGSGGDSEEGEGASPTAGMELGFLGSSLRPYVFFSSTSELMKHAWAGTASDPTPVLQSVVAFSDDERIVVLTNGMTVRGQLRGVLSSDASASIQISLWNRNSKSLVQTKGALLMRGSVTVDAGFVNSQGAIQFNGESSIDFKTDLDFYESPFTLCVQMEHPDIAVKFDVHRTTSVPGTKYQMRRSTKRTIKIPGRSFAINDKNNKMCQALNSNN